MSAATGSEAQPCPPCEGRGLIESQEGAYRCSACRGTGVVFEDPGPKADARKTDPRTSKQAARGSWGRREQRKVKALRWFQEAGTAGLTDYELSIKLGIPQMRNVAAKVRGRLVAEEWVRPAGRTRPTDTGYQATVWVISSQGREVGLEDLFGERVKRG